MNKSKKNPLNAMGKYCDIPNKKVVTQFVVP